MTLSKNGIALVLFVLGGFGITVTESQVMDVISAVVQLISFILLVWNQVQRPDVEHFLFKK